MALTSTRISSVCMEEDLYPPRSWLVTWVPAFFVRGGSTTLVSGVAGLDPGGIMAIRGTLRSRVSSLPVCLWLKVSKTGNAGSV